MLTTLNAAPGDVKTEVLDLDLKTRGGKPVPVRLFHKVAFGADGTPGVSRTLVLNRAKDDGTDPQRAAEVRFMRFFQNTPMAIATVDKLGGIARSNARFASSFEGMLDGGRSILSVVAERDRAALEAAIAKAAEGQGDIAPVEAALAGSNERWATFFVSAIEEEDRDGEAAIVYALETTAERTLENRVYQQQKMESVGQLAGGIAHDFNNVLSAIMMATDFLLNAHKPTDPSFQDIIQIKQNANRAAALVRQLLAFSRKQTLRPQVLDLGEALSDLGMLLRRLIGERVTLKTGLGRDLWPVKVDLSQFEQVVVNLSVNARDAMPDGGTLDHAHRQCDGGRMRQVRLQRHAGCRLCAGRGERHRHRHSARDHREDLRAVLLDQGSRQGHGLGALDGLRHRQADRRLRLCRQRAGPHLVPHFPAAPCSGRRRAGRAIAALAPSIAPALDSAPRLPRPWRNRPRADLTGHGIILLVEDEEGLRALNARGLTSRGYTVLEAGNGVEAIEVLEANGHVDLVVSDVVMPEMDGPSLLRELRGRDPNVKFIFVSGYAEEAFAKNLPSDQQYNFLAKPFTLKQLVAEVKKTLAGGQ